MMRFWNYDGEVVARSGRTSLEGFGSEDVVRERYPLSGDNHRALSGEVSICARISRGVERYGGYGAV